MKELLSMLVFIGLLFGCFNRTSNLDLKDKAPEIKIIHGDLTEDDLSNDSIAIIDAIKGVMFNCASEDIQ